MHINLKDIIVGENRQRREFAAEAINELARSIQNLGLLHPVVCRKTENGLELVAGERRLRAIQSLAELDIPFVCGDAAYSGGMVPVTLVSELSDEAAFEAELEENILRVDLTWQERSLAIDRLHELRKSQAHREERVHTIKDTASEVRGAPANNFDITKTSEEIILAKHLDDPEVAKAASKKEALKIVEKKAKIAHRAKLAEEFSAAPSLHKLLRGSCFELLKEIPNESIDLLLTDPPYGMDASEFSSNFSLKHEYEDNWQYFLDISHMLAEQAYRVLKPDTHGYIFCSFEGWPVLAKDFANAGFRVWPQPMIWAKGNGNAPWISKGHKKTYECILFVSKGMREVTTVKTDVLFYTNESDKEHGAQKPVELYKDLISRSTSPGNIVLDPFCGSGTIFPAAKASSCIAIGMERDEDYFNLALVRMQGE